MKKILLSLMTIAVIGLTATMQAQTCNLTTPLIKFTSGTGIAPFNIGEAPNAIVDWETYILNPGTGNATTPFNPPATSAANYSLDGAGAIGPDLDSPTPPRDLRFFAFTYDNYNVYFYFRRINNSNAQSTFYYLLDVNANGYMGEGEPVIRANFNSGAVTNFGLYNFIPSATDFVAGQGNYMTKPTAPNAGLADGYGVQGSMLNTSVTLPALLANEKFAAAITEGGFGVEFAVPWRFLRNWQFGGTPLAPGDVFTYHVSTDNGTGGYTTGNAEDNAGGCCSGLASVGEVKYQIQSPIPVSTIIPNLEYSGSIKINNTGNAPTKVSLNSIELNLIVQNASRPINELDFVVKGYIDANGDGIVNGTDAATLKTFTYVSGTFIVQPIIYTSPTPRDTVSLAPFGSAYFILDIRFPLNYSVKSLSVNITTNGVLNLPLGPCQFAALEQNASVPFPILTTLPVVFKSFTAIRNKANVMVKWETASEQNSSGFAVERNINGSWEQVAFVSSQAVNGNSEATLSYQYIDLNNTKGITQYRIKQVDMDAKSKYSEIRSVRGEGQLGKTVVYPNPTNDGKVNIVFEDGNVSRDISVSDMSGRTIKQLRGITNNNITIENLTPGIYSLRIVVPSTGEQSVEKIVVNKR